MKINYIGVNDYNIDLFEGQYKVSNGMAYNSYLIEDEKIVVMDTVDKNFISEWMDNIEKILKGRIVDYLVIQHMEPDHSSGIECFVNKYPNTKIVGNTKTFQMINQFFPNLSSINKVEVKDNEEISIGSSTLKFIFAPMVHWPEVMFTYIKEEQALFSADAFGKFGTVNTKEEWIDEARRYYIGIVGKYGNVVNNVLKKASTLDIKTIYPLHGPILNENLGYYINLYSKWASYDFEDEGYIIVYASVYGHTKAAADLLYSELCKQQKQVEIFDLTRCDIHEVISKSFMHKNLVIASITYNGGLFPVVNTFLSGLLERNYQKRSITIIENGTWAPTAGKQIMDKFEKAKDITFNNIITIKSSMKKEDEDLITKINNN